MISSFLQNKIYLWYKIQKYIIIKLTYISVLIGRFNLLRENVLSEKVWDSRECMLTQLTTFFLELLLNVNNAASQMSTTCMHTLFQKTQGFGRPITFKVFLLLNCYVLPNLERQYHTSWEESAQFEVLVYLSQHQ